METAPADRAKTTSAQASASIRDIFLISLACRLKGGARSGTIGGKRAGWKRRQPNDVDSRRALQKSSGCGQNVIANRLRSGGAPPIFVLPGKETPRCSPSERSSKCR